MGGCQTVLLSDYLDMTNMPFACVHSLVKDDKQVTDTWPVL